MKKNVLYLAPTLDSSLHGLLSNVLFSDLKDITNIEIDHIPIYVDDQHCSSIKMDSYKEISNYDTVIQYAPLNYLVSNNKIKDNIMIPMLGYIDSSIVNKLRCCTFSKILLNNKYHLDHLKNIFGNRAIQYKSKLLTDKKDKINKKYNLNLYQHTNKFYVVTSYVNEKYLLKKIITAFLLAFRDSQDNSLLLFSHSAEEVAQINKLIETISSDLSVISSRYKIQVIPFSYSLEQLEIIHNTGNIYIQTWLSSYEDHILAQKYNNKVLYLSRTDSVRIPNIIDFGTEQIENSPVTLNIMQDMISTINNKPKYFSIDSKSIRDILR